MRSPRRAPSTTLAPCAASSRAVASPNPLLAPVITTTFPSILLLITFTPMNSGLVLFVADLLHPVDRLAVELFQNGNMRHRGGRRGAVPMLLAGRTPDYVAGPDFLFRFAPTLRPAASGGDDQRLPERMGMPRRARAGFERYQCAISTGRIGRVEQRFDP